MCNASMYRDLRVGARGVGARNASRLSNMCSIGMYRSLRDGARGGGARNAPHLSWRGSFDGRRRRRNIGNIGNPGPDQANVSLG